MVKIRLEVSYSQLAIFASALADPFNDWTDQHVAQGFAWRSGSASFRTLVEAGLHEIDVDVVDHVGLVDPSTIRAIEVPFEVPMDGSIEVASIAESSPLNLPPGEFLLRCEFLQPKTQEVHPVRLVFAKKDSLHFAIVRADEELSVDGELLTSADAARVR